MDKDKVIEYIKSQAVRMEALEQAVKEALSIVGALWADVNYHPSSKWARDVKYFTDVLKGE